MGAAISSDQTDSIPVGDASDFARRLSAVLPRRWFDDDSPVLLILLQGMGSAFADFWSLLTFTRLQTRLSTATAAFLDLASFDYLPAFLRRANEPDAAFSLRLRREIVRPRNTRQAIVQVLQDLTGNTPTVFRPSNAADTGGIGSGGLGIGVVGGYGSLALPFQAFVTIQRGTALGAGGTATSVYGQAGIGSPIGGIGIGAIGYGDGSPVRGAVTDDDVYAAVASVTPAGHVNWVQIGGVPALPTQALADEARVGVDFLAA